MSQLISFLNYFQKKNLIFFIFIGILNSLIEILGISLLIPIFDILLNNELDNKYVDFIENYNLSFISENFLINLIIIILITYFVKLLLSLSITYFTASILENMRVYIQSEVLKNYFNKPLINHNDESIAVQIRTITQEANSSLYVINNLLGFFIEFTLLFFIVIFLFINFFNIAFISLLLFLSFFLIYYMLLDKKIKLIGIERIEKENLFYKTIYNSLNILRDIKFLKKENFFINLIKNIIFDLRKITILDAMYGGLIRPFIEFFVIFIILAILFYSKFYLNLENSEIISALGIFLAAIIRCFPSITKIMSQYQKITFRKKSVGIIMKHLNEIREKIKIKAPQNISFEFEKSIEIKNINFSYKDRGDLFLNLNFEINKGDVLGILGKNGSGKSTLLDIISGVTSPISGKVLVDKVDIKLNYEKWQEKIIYLSQKNLLIENTLLSNITLGEKINEIDQKKLDYSLKISNFYNSLNDFPDKLNTQLGGNNFKLSGGQQKKIQIARCFYQIDERKKLIILDEPTENLDLTTKNIFFKNLKNLKEKFTIILISHLIEDLEICNKIYDLNEKKLITKFN